MGIGSHYSYFILGIAPSPHWWTDFDDLYAVFPRKEVPFAGRDEAASHLGGQISLSANVNIFKNMGRIFNNAFNLF